MGPEETDSGAPVPAGLASGGAAPTADVDAFTQHLLAKRHGKDAFFARSAHSPLAPDCQRAFAGLAYYPPDPAYRLAGLSLEPTGGHPRPFAIGTSDGRSRTAYRLGRLRFVLAGRALVLMAYKMGDIRSDSLFVPFKDETSGRDTYVAGRYLDLRPEPDGTYVLDFNDAYNPYCAYSNSYSCPLPPGENELPVPIEAGERLDATLPTRSTEHGS